MQLWEQLIELSNNIENLFNTHLDKVQIQEPVNFEGWKDVYWKSNLIRKCHLKIIDNRETQKLWLMHINIFPSINTNIPILGFDIVAGQNKITGSFFDFSPVSEYHPYHDYFKNTVENLSWNKPRELPDWARSIFSKNMIAAGNIRTDAEVQQLCTVCFNLIDYYLSNISSTDPGNYKVQHNFYCKQQKLNPHLHKSILAMGISETDKDRYVNKVLFEEI